MEKQRIRRNIRTGWIALFMAFLLLSTGWLSAGQRVDATGGGKSETRLEVHYIDVGQGDATLIQSDGHAMLIDAGNNNKGTAIQSYLQKQNVKTLDYVIGTHPDADHIGGLDVILYKLECGKVLLPDYSKDTKTYRDVVDTLKAKSYRAIHPKVGDTYELGDAVFTVTAPAGSKYDSANDYSIAIHLEYGETRFLFVGDAEEKSTEEMLKTNQNLTANVYKVSHHGSRNGTSEEFLKAVNPEYAVISCGEDNSYGHPHAEVMNLLRSKGVDVYRTDEQGTIVAQSDGKKITWNMSPDTSWKSGEPKGTRSDAEPAAESVKKIKSNTSFVLNTNTKKIHLPSCGSMKKMADKNKKKTTKSIDKLEAEGYTTCKNCFAE